MPGDPEQIVEHAIAELDRLGSEIRVLLAATRSKLIETRGPTREPAEPPEPKAAYTIAEAARLLRVCANTVYRHQEELEVITVGGRKFIPSYVIEQRLAGRQEFESPLRLSGT